MLKKKKDANTPTPQINLSPLKATEEYKKPENPVSNKLSLKDMLENIGGSNDSIEGLPRKNQKRVKSEIQTN